MQCTTFWNFNGMKHYYKHLIIIISFILSLCFRSAAAESAPRVSLVTFYAGADIYELEGHSALRVILPDGSDYMASYGMFDFDSPNFVYRFVSGQTDYMLGLIDSQRFLYHYIADERRIVEQQLQLSDDEAWRLHDLLIENFRPENRTYRYNYVKDNCATRPVAMIERAIGDSITFSQPSINGSENWTFRDEMRYYHKNYPWYQFGIDLALGSGLDYPLTAREKAFAPETLIDMMSRATRPDSLGNPTPIVINTTILNEGRHGGVQLPPTPWYATPMSAAILLLLVTIAVAGYDIKRHNVSRGYHSLIFLLFGIAGCVIAFLVFISSHEATSPNWLLIWLNPLALLPAVGIWLKKWKTILFYYHFVNFVALFLLVIVWNWLGQVANAAFFPLIATDAILSASYIYMYKCNVSNR